MPIRVRVLYFGQAREAAGTGEEEFSLPSASSVGELIGRTTRAHQKLRRIEASMRFAVNEEVVPEERRLADGDVVAFLPPVAGG